MKIRKEKYWLDDSDRRGEENPLLEDLQESIEKLSKDVYGKVSHFIVELIQNAEDNSYIHKNPSLSFTLVKDDPTDSPDSDGALIIVNNEVGFSEANMKAMCRIGASLKEKRDGYIGEKGIGFKSVFNITNSPYIFSNNYQVRFPEKINDLGLGFIVPEWVELVPDGVDINQTTIILPLAKGKSNFSEVFNMMKEFSPETILFLDKIRYLRFSVEYEYELCIEKIVENDTFVHINVHTRDRAVEANEQRKYLLYTKKYQRPDNLFAEDRDGVSDRDITIAFPTDNQSIKGSIYAYLPVLENTGLPFIINADFLLTSSREALDETSPWNIWLRYQIPDLFIEAFTKLIRSKDYRYEIFKHIPLASKVSFFEPIVSEIHEGLAKLEIIPTEPGGNFVVPSHTLSSVEFRRVISDLKLPPVLVNRLIKKELQNAMPSKVGEAIGIEPIGQTHVSQCLTDADWVLSIGFEGLIRVYEYLSKHTNQYENQTVVLGLTHYPIIPIKESKKVRYSCVNEQPIYFEATEQDIQALKGAPACIKVPIRFLNDSFYNLVKEYPNLMSWLANTLRVKHFDLANYAEEVFKWFKSIYQSLSDEDFIAATEYILLHMRKEMVIDDIPILLSNGNKVPLSSINRRSDELITPMGLDPESGWQNLFSSVEDRLHLHILSDSYLKENGKIPTLVTLANASRYPSLPTEEIYPNLIDLYHWRDSNDYSVEEKETLQWGTEYSANSRLSELTLRRVKRPSGLAAEITPKVSLSLVKWLNGIGIKGTYELEDKLKSKVTSYNRRPRSQKLSSEMTDFLDKRPWVPTTKGFYEPSRVFKNVPDIMDVLGDTVPYLEDTITFNDNVTEYFKIIDRLSNDQLISTLKSYSSSCSGSVEMAERIYSTLNPRILNSDTKEDIKAKLFSMDCVLIPSGDSKKWVSLNVCIWNDRSDLFPNEFCYLEKTYPKLREFFVGTLGVATDIGDREFCKLWLDTQMHEAIEADRIEAKLVIVYNKLKMRFANEPDNNEGWWQDFLSQAKLWSTNKHFVDRGLVLIPDDGGLMEIFGDQRIEYAWYPKTTSYGNWEDMYQTFGIRSLKGSVLSGLISLDEPQLINPNRYLTRSSKLLIGIWIKEKRLDLYNSLKSDDLLKKAFNLLEYSVNTLKLEYHLDGESVQQSSNCYCDLLHKRLIYKESANISEIAYELARILSITGFDEELQSWIKGCLGNGESDLAHTLKEKNWKLGDDLLQLLSEEASSSAPEEEDDDDNAAQADDDRAGGGTDSSSQDGAQQRHKTRGPYSGGSSGQSSGKGANNKTNSDERSDFEEDSATEDNEEKEAEQSFAEELFSGFNTKDKPINDDDEWNDDNGSSNDPQGRYEKEYDRASDKNKNSRDQAERYREVRRRILDGPDPIVRESLNRWYSGKCQICGSTFCQKNGRPFFISHFLVPRKVSDSADMTGNAICLCAHHFAQMVYGRLKSPGVIEQIESIDPTSESFELDLILNGEELSIKYIQKHAIALKAFYESTKEESKEDL